MFVSLSLFMCLDLSSSIFVKFVFIESSMIRNTDVLKFVCGRMLGIQKARKNTSLIYDIKTGIYKCINFNCLVSEYKIKMIGPYQIKFLLLVRIKPKKTD